MLKKIKSNWFVSISMLIVDHVTFLPFLANDCWKDGFIWDLLCSNSKLFTFLPFSFLSFTISYQQMVSFIVTYSPGYILPTLLQQVSYHTTTALFSTDLWSKFIFLNVHSRLVLRHALGLLVNLSFSPASFDLSFGIHAWFFIHQSNLTIKAL